MWSLLALELVVKSAAFGAGAPIPKEYTCQGADRSPALELQTEMPAGSRSWVVIVDDPDAPTEKPFVHWVLWNVSAKFRSIGENFPRDIWKLPDGSVQGKNDFGNIGWNGPCPPPGKPHRYRFRVFTVSGVLALPNRSSAGDVERAIRGKITGEGTLIGTFQR
jgi:Raf kinase inhibitor-like YbhB/YbcL family protein